MYIWLGSQLDPMFVQDLLGLQTVAHIQPEKVKNFNLFIYICVHIKHVFICSVASWNLTIHYQRTFEHC